ncbi:unnamed protein product [Linum trigynum]|uniref:Uncharacterized protein n=1 Tax=Linum trigynum TaxID=586398 RepID=A0AAV2GQA6_9ROSI
MPYFSKRRFRSPHCEIEEEDLGSLVESQKKGEKRDKKATRKKLNDSRKEEGIGGSGERGNGDSGGDRGQWVRKEVCGGS